LILNSISKFSVKGKKLSEKLSFSHSLYTKKLSLLHKSKQKKRAILKTF
jgi:hypothetical protein